MSGSELLEKCLMCGGNRFKKKASPLHGIGEDFFREHSPGLALVKCRDCGMVFVNPRPRAEVLGEFYSTQAYEAHDRTMETGNIPLYRYLLEFIGSCRQEDGPGRLLDYGCGGGAFLAYAQHNGWQVKGFDVSPKAIDTCRQKQLEAATDLDALEASDFDVIVLNHVIEHMDAPVENLADLSKKLAKGGIMVIATPNYHSLRALCSLPPLVRHFNLEERYHAFPIHLFGFSPKTLAQTVQNAGLNPIKASTYGFGIDSLFRKQENTQVNAGNRNEPNAPPKENQARTAYHKELIKSFSSEWGWVRT